MNISTRKRRFRAGRLLSGMLVIATVVACSDPAPEDTSGVSMQTPDLEPAVSELPATDVDFGSLINVAGRQRMLTQRIVKAYLQLLLNVEPASTEEQRRRSIDRFEQQLTELERHEIGIAASEALEEVRNLWAQFRADALSDPDPAKTAQLRQDADRLLVACEAVVGALVDAAPHKLAEHVNVSGRQRMLSQRFSMLYMLMAAGLGSPSVQTELSRVRNEFEGALRWLRESEDNTPATREILDEMADMWLWLDGALKIQSDKYYPWIVADVSEKTLKAAETLTDLYAERAD